MNVLPRVNFLFSMLPLPPPEHFFKELNTAISRFIWMKKKPRIRLKTMQRKKLDGGLSLPNFELYNLAFQIRGIRIWVNSDSPVPWRVLEANIIHPVRLQDLPFSGISKSLKKTYGPIIEYLLDAWKKVEKIMGGPFLYTKTTPLWHNNRLCTGNKPFVFKTWSDAGVHTLNDIYCDNGLKSFQDLSAEFSLPGFSFFLYLRLRSALKAYGVPWATNVLSHPLWEWLNIDTPSSGLVSKIYNSILLLQYTSIPKIWF
uniref:Reverse transcriptase n=1 Tax=Cyprinus carpio carpio TaxID=630221 RepID=A0A9J7ZM10_CYPCA